ncbi:phosphoribosyltransferase [bacterium]|nr:phosphoribosyltransferase [bacterium]
MYFKTQSVIASSHMFGYKERALHPEITSLLCKSKTTISTPSSLTALHTPFCYLSPVGKAIRDCKRSGSLTLLHSICHLVNVYAEQYLSEATWDFILPLPSRWRSIRERGFHMPLEIAKRLSHSCNGQPLSFVERCSLVYPPWQAIEKPQKFLSKEGRDLRSLTSPDVFFKTRLKGSSILLVDDVLATGKTLESVVKVLLPALPRRVEAFCLAHTHDKTEQCKQIH